MRQIIEIDTCYPPGSSKNFGNKGYIKSTSNTAPMIYKNSLVILSPLGKIESFNIKNGKKISEVKIHEKKIKAQKEKN